MATKIQEATKVAETRKVSKVVVANAERLAFVRAEVIRLEAEAKLLRDGILAVADGATTLIHNNIAIVEIGARNTSSIDTALLKKLYPEAYAAVRRSGVSPVVEILKR